MKINSIKNNFFIKTAGKQSKVENRRPSFINRSEFQTTPYLGKQFYIANSNINFKGHECSPSKFKIKTAYGIDCPCCGQTMLTKRQSNAFVSRISGKKGAELEQELNKEYRYFRKNEQEIADILIEDTKKYPDYDLTTLVAQEAKSSMEKLVKNQKQLIKQMREDSLRLSIEKRMELDFILNDEENLIDNSDDFVHFKRRNFVDKIYDFRGNCLGHDAQVACEILEKAQSMPNSATNKDAFFVKYARRKNEDIARRLILPAMSTTEHIKPQSKNGKNNTDNYIPLCGDCNSRRGNIPYWEWFKIHPEMPQNLQKYIYQAAAVINSDENDSCWSFYDTYTDDVIKAIFDETRGTIKLMSPEEAKEKGLLEEDFEETMLPSRKPKTIEEKREILMEKYEMLTGKIKSLTSIKDNLFSNPEYLNIAAFVHYSTLLVSAERILKTFEDNKNIANAALNKAKRNYKSALSKNESTSELESKIAEKDEKYAEAKADYEQQLMRTEELKEKIAELRQNGVVTPDDIAADISALKQNLQNIAGADLTGVNADYEISEITAKIDSLQKNIEGMKQLNELAKQNIDFGSKSFIRTQARYLNLSAKIKTIEKIDRARFKQYFLSSGKDMQNCDFILDEALSSLQKQFAFLLKNPLALYIKREDNIKELNGQKSAYEAKLEKMKEISEIQSEIHALEKRKTAVSKKFAYVNIEEDIEKLQKQADEYLQDYTDSFKDID